ncbi:unnamed protein product [Brachionus calyciflorus]|uniref:Uncharacterized protein n=1 Tax=Brachionus calyciflorus TaxID=104777 RepID=A0A814L6S8_9BILA|nr:unnamed protein product [Brachionus calyciflorus]
MKQTAFNIAKLTKITTQVFIEQNIDPIKFPKLSRSDDNVWSKISENYFGIKSHANALIIFTWYRRNTQNFAKNVEIEIENSLKADPLKCDTENFENIEIIFTKSDFNRFKVSGTERKRLLVDFEEAINIKLSQQGFNCYFRNNYNWFKKENDSKKKEIWSGLYTCIEPSCSNFIKTSILDRNKENITVFVLYSGINDHEKINKKLRVSGIERKKLGIRLKADGVLNTLYEMNYNKSSKVQLKTLQKIKNELDNKFRLSRDLIFDLKATKILSENIGISTNSEFKGFVHNICLDPYGFLLMSDIQVIFKN